MHSLCKRKNVDDREASQIPFGQELGFHLWHIWLYLVLWYLIMFQSETSAVLSSSGLLKYVMMKTVMVMLFNMLSLLLHSHMCRLSKHHDFCFLYAFYHHHCRLHKDFIWPSDFLKPTLEPCFWIQYILVKGLSYHTVFPLRIKHFSPLYSFHPKGNWTTFILLLLML